MAKTPSTQLTVIERASVALGASEHEKKLIELAKQSTEITVITNKDGYQQCHAARMVLVKERVALEKLGKDARDDATKFSKAVIAEEKRLIALIEGEEKRLQVIQDAWDAIEDQKRQAEADRIAALQDAIEIIKMSPVQLAGQPSAAIAERLAEVRAIDCTTFAEFESFAQEAREKAIFGLNQLHIGAVAQEKAAAEAAEKIRLDQEELAKLRAAEEQRKQEETARLAEEAKARAQAEAESRARIDAEERASKERIAKEEAEAREKRRIEDERLEQERQRLAAIEKEARDKEAAEAQARADAQAKEEARLKAEREALEAKQREIQRQADELLDGTTMLETFMTRYGKRQEFKSVVTAIHAFLVQLKKAA